MIDQLLHVDYAFLAFVLIGTSYAAYLDLKTSEVPDWVSLLVGGGSILYYLGNSVSLPFQAADAYMVGGVLTFAAGVALFLRMHRLVLSDAPGGDNTTHNHSLIAEADAYLPVPITDIAGGAAFIATASLFYTAYTLSGIQPVMLSVMAGTMLFAIGWSMYVAGMWGGADAFVLGAVGYAFPYIPVETGSVITLPAPFSLVFNVFVVGAVYSTVYAVVMALRDEDAMAQFWRDLVAYRWRGLGMLAGYGAVSLALSYAVQMTRGVPATLLMRQMLLFLPAMAALLVLYQFLKTVEDHVMRKTVTVDELQPGDVLGEDLDDLGDAVDAERIVGLTADQVEAIRAEYDTVEIRSGVRFIGAFPLAILVLLFFGDPLSFIMTLSGA